MLGMDSYDQTFVNKLPLNPGLVVYDSSKARSCLYNLSRSRLYLLYR